MKAIPLKRSLAMLAGALFLEAPLVRGEIIHRWSFSETTGTSLADSVGGSTGTIQVLGGSGHMLGSGELTLDGGAKATSDYADLGANILSGLSEATIELWATRESISSWARVFSIGNGVGAANSWWLSAARVNNGNQQRLRYQGVGTNIDSSLSTSDGAEHHYAVVWDDDGGALGEGRLEWYRDGVYVEGADVGSNTPIDVNDAVFWLGRSEANDDTANMSFNEVRVYSEALSPAAIAANKALGPGNATGTAPVAAGDSVTLNPGDAARLPVLANDTGTGISKQTVEIVMPPSSGSAVPDADGQILYTHSGVVTGIDSFTYRVGNIFGTMSAPATVNVTITNDVRVENTTLQMPDAPPELGFEGVNAFPGVSFVDPICLRTPPGETGRLFVAEKRGRIYVVPDVAAPAPTSVLFLNLAALVNGRAGETMNTSGEGGLLGLAFHPDYATNGQFFVYYTVNIDNGGGNFLAHDRLARFVVSGGDPNAADTASEQVFFNQRDEATNHNGGGMHFGPLDGYLYLSLGDEGGGNDSWNNSQRIDKDFFSAMLRIDVDKKAGNELPNDHLSIVTHNGAAVSAGGIPFYLVPSDNPWAGPGTFSFNDVIYDPDASGSAVRTEFWAVGLRNPWRWWFDPVTDELILADVGQGQREEIDIIQPGKNYGWSAFEGTRVRIAAPPGMVHEPPIYEYDHGGGAFQGNSVTGGVVYYGTDPLTDLPELDGLYIFADYVSGNVWSLDRSGPVTVERLFGDTGIICFGYDPSNGDLLYGDNNDDIVKRLVRTTADESFPKTLSDTGAFSDLAALDANPGMHFYEPNVAFWSDFGIKRRWFSVPSLPDKITFSKDDNWTFPEGAVWVKHFDLEMTRGNPATKKRVETRFLVKTASGSYGVSYRWNAAETEAYLVEDAGLDIDYVIDDGGPVNQTWRIPSRAECIACHTPVGGHALSFNTRQLNRDGVFGGIGGASQNQIEALSDAGYFTGAVSGVNTMPAFASPGDATKSLEYRVRSYLAVNCVQCHQDGGPAAPAAWDARAKLRLQDLGLINADANNNGGDPLKKLIVPGSEANSILLHRIQASGGFGRMPNIGSNVLDETAIQLVKDWINLSLPGRQFYDDWKTIHFGVSPGPEADEKADPNWDGEVNLIEFLTGQNPLAQQRWDAAMTITGGNVRFDFDRVENVGIQLMTSEDLENWSLWDVTGNHLCFGAGGADAIEGAFDPGTNPELYFRWLFTEP